MDIIKSNTLIAEFIGRRGKENKQLFTFEGVADFMMGDPWYFIAQSKFHCDINWLMPVIEKIEKLLLCTNIGYGGKYYNCQISKHPQLHLPYDKNNTFKNIYISSNKSKVDAVYIAIIFFIEWYNKQK